MDKSTETQVALLLQNMTHSCILTIYHYDVLNKVDRIIIMLFNSLQFLIFFPIVVLIYYIIPSKYRHIWLLAASYYFYMCWNVKYIILLLLSTIITYLCGLYLEHLKQLSPPSDNMHLQAKKNLCIAIGFTLTYVSFSYLNILIL